MVKINEAEKRLRILHLEDSPRDAELIRELLVDAGFSPLIDWASNELEFTAFLRSNAYELILADYQLPGFEAPAALRLAKSLCPGIPFICVSGAIGEGKAVELLKLGATDYIPKDRLDKLPLAMKRALDEVAERSTRRAADEALRNERNLIANIMQTSPVGITTVDSMGSITFANAKAIAILGLSKDQIDQTTYNSPVWNISDIDGGPFPDDRLPFTRVMSTGKAVTDVQHAIQWPDGKRILLSINGAPMMDVNGQVAGMVASIEDITERKKTEELIQRSLKEKTVMLQEIHHRVKNNMQVITSLLNLQSHEITDANIRALFEESKNRIYSMALIHEKLYRAEDLARISFNEYLHSLVSGIVDTYKRRDIIYAVDNDPITLDVNVGIPCGLIANELVSNCLKYAFPEGRKGMITLGINKDTQGNNVLTVADNGVGFPDTVDFRNTTTLGLKLVNVLSGQIHGVIELSRVEGTTFRITFPGSKGNE